MRTPLIAANWKMNTTLSEAAALVREMRDSLDMVKSVDKVLCPPFISIAAVCELVKSTSIKVGAQNMYFQPKGAFTGEISAVMLRDLCDYVIIGHSERRQYFAETDDDVNRKLKAALDAGLAPILCVGESLEIREKNEADSYIRSQITNGLHGINTIDTMVVAYEPIWAIGTGRAATAEQADKVCGWIRDMVSTLYGAEAAQRMRILYGGSVTPDNITDFISRPDIDGALVGGASLKANDFIAIVKNASLV